MTQPPKNATKAEVDKSTSPTPLVATPPTNVTHTSPSSTLDGQLVTPQAMAADAPSISPFVPSISPFAAATQPPWPTTWPPVTPPAPKVHLDSYVPYAEWQKVLATRSHVTDPPPCPVTASFYPGLTINTK